MQVDVKHLKLGGRRFYQFTAVDEAIDEVRHRLPMAIQRVQTDHGNEFGTDFTWHLRDDRVPFPIGTPFQRHLCLVTIPPLLVATADRASLA